MLVGEVSRGDMYCRTGVMGGDDVVSMVGEWVRSSIGDCVVLF